MTGEVDPDLEGTTAGDAEEPPPVGGSWRNLYLVVLVNLAVLIGFLWLLTRAFG